MSRRDAAGSLLAAAVRLLPAERGEWGTAMRAELAGLDARPQRWSFTLGCLRVIATRPSVWRYAGYPLLVLGALAATVYRTAHVAYPPLHWGLIGMVAILLVITGVRVLLPVAGNRVARSLRALGYLLVGTLAAGAVAFSAHQNHHSVGGVPVLTVMFAGQLLGFQALTARRQAATPRSLFTGALAGCAAAAGWTVAVVAFPPIPADPGRALLVTAVAAGAAAAVTARGGGPAALSAGACAGLVGALVTLHVVLLLSVAGPARLIPELVPASLSPADQLANSRIEIQDPYMWLLLLAWFVALGPALASLNARRVARAG